VIGLDKEIPHEIYKHIKPFCANLMTVEHSSFGPHTSPLYCSTVCHHLFITHMPRIDFIRARQGAREGL
jgi:hypothetical protein